MEGLLDIIIQTLRSVLPNLSTIPHGSESDRGRCNLDLPFCHATSVMRVSFLLVLGGPRSDSTPVHVLRTEATYSTQASASSQSWLTLRRSESQWSSSKARRFAALRSMVATTARRASVKG